MNWKNMVGKKIFRKALLHSFRSVVAMAMLVFSGCRNNSRQDASHVPDPANHDSQDLAVKIAYGDLVAEYGTDIGPLKFFGSFPSEHSIHIMYSGPEGKIDEVMEKFDLLLDRQMDIVSQKLEDKSIMPIVFRGKTYIGAAWHMDRSELEDMGLQCAKRNRPRVIVSPAGDGFKLEFLPEQN